MKLTARQHRLIDPPRETEVPPFPVRRFTVAEYHQLLKVGILRDGDPYELLRGWIVPKPKASPPNASARSRLMRRLLTMFRENEWIVGANHPITFVDSEPEPSSTVFRGPDDMFTRRHPRPSECELVAEVSDVTLDRVRGIKLVLYASGRIPGYWIVNIPERRVEVYSDPRGGKNPIYRTSTTYGPDDAVPVVVAGKTRGTIPVSELLP
jgi:hypothetical protein